MQVLIKVHYTFNSVKCLQTGSFPVNYRDYKQDPDKAVSVQAVKFVIEIQKQFPEMEIIKVLFNEDIDISNLVREMK